MTAKRGSCNNAGGQRKHLDFLAKRRREIVLHARHVGAAGTEDFSRWLIAWVWHNPLAKDQVWSLMECAKNMGGKITEAEASEMIEEASIPRKHLSADNLARFLGLTYAQRQALGLTTIGSIDVGRRARKELRKRRDRLAKERKRRAAGMRPQSESLSATQPWRELGMSRAAWYRRNKRRNETGETTLSTASFLSTADRPVSGMEAGTSEHGFAMKKETRPEAAPPEAANVSAGLPSSRTATTVAADRPVNRAETIPISRVPHWVFGLRPGSMARRAA